MRNTRLATTDLKGGNWMLGQSSPEHRIDPVSHSIQSERDLRAAMATY